MAVPLGPDGSPDSGGPDNGPVRHRSRTDPAAVDGAAGAAGHRAVARPPLGDVLLMAVAVAAVSTAAPLIATIAAPALAIAFWRNAMATGLLGPLAVFRFRHELRRLGGQGWLLALGAGAMLALHFATWIPALSLTTVSSVVALVSTQPVWAALIARARGAEVPARAWVGIVVAVLGAGALSGVDFALSVRALFGDLLAMAGGVFGAAYVTLGAEVRRRVSTTSYTAVCYLAAAAVLLTACVASGQRIGGYDARTWLMLAALTLGPQLLGHTVFNRVLRTTSATVVSLAYLLEVPGATIIAAVWLGQLPPLATIPAVLLLLAGIAVVVGGREPPPTDGRAEPDG